MNCNTTNSLKHCLKEIQKVQQKFLLKNFLANADTLKKIKKDLEIKKFKKNLKVCKSLKQSFKFWCNNFKYFFKLLYKNYIFRRDFNLIHRAKNL